MPHPTAFLAGFGLTPGTQFGDFTLMKAHSTHEQIRRFHDYQYHITLVFMPQWGHRGNYADLVSILEPILSSIRIIDSEYGNPYECTIQAGPEDAIENQDGSYTIYLVGHSTRIYHH